MAGTKRENNDSDDEIISIPQKMPQGREDDSDDQKPVTALRKTKREKKEDDDDERIVVKRRKVVKKEVEKNGKAQKVKKEKTESVKKGTKAGKKTTIKKEETKKTKKKLVIPQPVHKWWEEKQLPEGVKWLNLEHNGVVFTPDYEPHNVPLVYDGKKVALSPKAEEVASFFAAVTELDHSKNPTFCKNFFDQFKAICKEEVRAKKMDVNITDFKKCDFSRIYEYQKEIREKRKERTSEEKKAEKKQKDEESAPYVQAVVDGRLEKVGNFRVEPPGLFRGRGEHPKTGMLKTRIYPDSVVINCGKNAMVPACPMPGFAWKDVVHNNKATWLAYYRDTVNGEYKYVWLAASSSIKGQSDMAKFEKARKLKDKIGHIRKTYTKELDSQTPIVAQRATALWIIDRLALRVGGEKNEEEEADTVGCTSLRVEHVDLSTENTVHFDFLGKDSIRYENTVQVDKKVFRNLKRFAKGLKKTDQLFSELNPQKLNAYLHSFMEGLTAKVFRTYNASITLDEKLQEMPDDLSLADKVVFYNMANRDVAILCNHQRALPKGHQGQMERMDEKLDKATADLKDAEKELKKAKKANDKKLITKYEKAVERFNTRITNLEAQKKIKDGLKTVALGTSKINYIDPRITVAWCKKHDVPINKIFNKTLQSKFTWAMTADGNFRF